MSIIKEDAFCERFFFTKSEHRMWSNIFNKQLINLQDKAYPDFFYYLEQLNLPANYIPYLQDLNTKIFKKNGWRIIPVTGLLSNSQYFQLLSTCQFPIAMIMRSSKEAFLSKDPDIFHEIFGHCTMLMSSDYAHFMQKFGEIALKMNEADRSVLARLLWFTTETGLIRTSKGIKIFGSSILSSYTESNYCLTSNEPIYKAFDLIEIFREPYRVDILQKTYFILDDVGQLYNRLDNFNTVLNAIHIARELGEYPPNFINTHDKYSNAGYF